MLLFDEGTGTSFTFDIRCDGINYKTFGRGRREAPTVLHERFFYVINLRFLVVVLILVF